MRKLTIAAVLATGLSLAACGGRGDDKLGDNVASQYDNAADSLEAQADNLEERADALRDEGDRKEEAIDDADVDARAMNDQAQANLSNAM